MILQAPFPWFGGKRRVANAVWQALGDVDNYVEPFTGSLAMLLGRPAKHTGTTETVNDFDMYIVNFWRAVKHAPDAVAYYANNPVNEADLTARHIWLVNTGHERILRIQGDPEYYDAQVAGWWCWGICCWIGGSWCAGDGPWSADENGMLINTSDKNGVSKKRVHLSDAGRGVNRQRVHLGSAGQGVDTGLEPITEWMIALAERLRYVRVCNGDWARVVTDGALSYGSTIGVFLDPPYDIDIRDSSIYNTDTDYGHISADVRDWCLANGDNPRYRIVLAGYEGEHEMPDTWRVMSWSSGASYQRANGGSANEENRHKERLWFSPYCLNGHVKTQMELW